MKAFSIQQPWGSLICAGIKDVENRKWALKSTPMRLLIHTGAKRHNIDEDTMPLVWMNPIENAQNIGILGNLRDLPTSAIVGVATVDYCIADADDEEPSIWAQEGPGAEYHWHVTDVKLFKNPILNVKGKLGIFDIPGITEDNLPECVDLTPIQRNGTNLRIPLCKDFFDQLKTGMADSIAFNLTEENLSLFAQDDDLEPLPTTSVTLVCDGEEINAPVADYTIEPVLDENDEPITFEDAFEREYDWYRVFIKLE